jgi:chemotaxis response regulator CheB
MAELLSKHTTMKVVEATDNTSVEADCVYVIPNNRNITMGNRIVQNHHGAIKASAVPDHGAIFAVYLPAADTENLSEPGYRLAAKGAKAFIGR